MAEKKKPASIIILNSEADEREMERLRQNVYRSDMEKFKLFTQMLRANALFKKAKVTHK
jgi:hypothetical protein